MLEFERNVARALGSAPDSLRGEVEAFVDGSLRAMPEVTRIAVMAETLVLGAYARTLARRGAGLRELLDRWETGTLAPARLYVHMFRSLVLFGENELRRPVDAH